MLGASSRVVGVQSYSDNSKKSSSLELISEVMRPSARESVLPNEADAVSRMIPPRWAELYAIGTLRCMVDVYTEELTEGW